MKPKIEYQANEKKPYGKLEEGEVFLFGDNVWMKTVDTGRALDLADGCHGAFADEDCVIPVETTITVMSAKSSEE